MDKLLLEVKSEIKFDKENEQKVQKTIKDLKNSIEIRREMLKNQNEFNPTEFFNLSFVINYQECLVYWLSHKPFDSKYWNCFNYLKYLYKEYKQFEFNPDFFFSKETIEQFIKNSNEE